VTWVLWNLVLVHLKTELAFVQDSCMVSSNVPYGQKSFWMHPMVLLGDKAQVEAHFSLFRDSVNLDSR
jgi:hypothetical protein